MNCRSSAAQARRLGERLNQAVRADAKAPSAFPTSRSYIEGARMLAQRIRRAGRS